MITVVKESSCSHGWLRWVIQCLFFAITVVMFILIMIFTVSNNSRYNPHCQIHGCRVICFEATFNNEYENDIIFAATEAETRCDWVLITLNRPAFLNSTLPPQWLSRMRTDIHELSIIGGNLKDISHLAFRTQFAGNIRSLVFSEITITTWNRYMLVGLTSLEELIFNNVTIKDIKRNALEAVDNTLDTLTLSASDIWSPVNVTGSANLIRLRIVDFSFNVFNSIQRKSFTSLKFCQILFLNSCGIRSIEPSAFDYLTNLMMLHLNDNFLVTIPIDLFRSIASNVNLRINLHNNRWLCDCGLKDLQSLSNNDIMLVDPICYFPEYVRGQSMREYFNNCGNNSATNDIVKNLFEARGSCATNKDIYSNLTVISPIDNFTCAFSNLKGLNLIKFTMKISGSSTFSDWLKPTFLVRSGGLAMVEITSTRVSPEFGIMWYQTECPHEISCLSVIPDFLRIYDIIDSTLYTFCPFHISTGLIKRDDCIVYSSQSIVCNVPIVTFYIYTAIASLTLGSLCVYLIIRRFPSLLKGNKRILFVKHKNMQALVLPPQITSTTKLDTEQMIRPNNTLIFVATGENRYLLENNLKRTKSILSNHSSVPSYISALQPTDEQLADWRLRHHVENNSIASISSYVTEESSLYSSLDQFSNKAHDSMKLSQT